MSEALHLEKWAEDNYVLSGTRCSNLTGTSAEWRAMAASLLNRTNAHFKRCAAYWNHTRNSVCLSCPRNSVSDDDVQLFSVEDAEALSQLITRALNDN